MSNDKKVKDGKGPVLHSLQELSTIDLTDQLDLPEEDLPEINQEALRARAEDRRAKKAKIQDWIMSRLAWLEQAGHLPQEEQEILAEKVAEVREGIKDLLDHQNDTFRRTAWAAFFSFQLKRDLKSQSQVESALGQLVKDGYLIVADRGSEGMVLKVYDRYYVIPDISGLVDTEYDEIRRLLANLIRRVYEAETHSDLSWEALLSGKKGFKTVGVPPEKVRDEVGDTTFWRPGCQLRIQSDGQRLWPVRIVATNENLRGAITEAMGMKLHLLLNSLGLAGPPFVRVRGDLDHESVRKIQLLWFLLKRGMKAEGEHRQRQYLKREMADRATISAEEFFLSGKPGVCLVDLEQPWEHKGDDNVVRVYYDVFCLVARTIEEIDGEPVPHISFDPTDSAQVPEHLQEYLSSCKGTFPEGEKFRGVSYPLLGMLQAAFGQTAKSVQITNGGN